MNSKMRLLPLFIFFAVLTLSVKINNLFDSLKTQNTEILSLSQTKAFAQQEEKKQEEKKIETETAKLNTILENSETAKISSSIVPGVATFTQSEITILQELAERREALDMRSRDIDRKTIRLQLAEEEIEKKLKQLQVYETKLKQLIDRYSERERERIQSLVKLYSTMKPKDAARIFNTLDTDIIVSLLQEMKPAAASAILAQIDPQKAKAVTDELVGNKFFEEGENRN